MNILAQVDATPKICTALAMKLETAVYIFTSKAIQQILMALVSTLKVVKQI